ncbi:hypothetical protein D3C78_445270 [compost metagenome]
MAQVVAVHLDGADAFAFRQVGAGDAAYEELGDLARLQAFDPGADFIDQADADLVVGELAVEDPLQCFLVLHDVGEQVVHFQDIDAALAHLGDEVEVVALGLVDPDHVVEQQLVAVVGGQAHMCEPRRADHYLMQFAGFRMNAEFDF